MTADALLLTTLLTAYGSISVLSARAVLRGRRPRGR